MSAGRRLAAALLVAVAATPAATGEISRGARRELRELKKLCDEGTVAPPVCLEKQRAILGLAPAAVTAPVDSAAVPPPERPVAATPPPAGDAPAADAPIAAEPVTHDSPFGFRVELPEGWSVVPPAEIDAGFDVLRERLAADPAAVALVDRLRSEGAHRRGEVYAAATDRLQVLASPASLPNDPTARMTLCPQLGSATSRAVGRTLATQTCSPRTVVGRPALLIERDALLPGARTLQYWVSTPDGGALSFVTSCRAEDADTRRTELERMIDSLRWP